jgi:hypothetical protein
LDRVPGFLGRLNVIVAAGLFAYDATSIALCTKNCLSSGQCEN